ncbi:MULTISPECIES: DUF4097 family beta strand repeat-containing protein [Streptococcus]|uniref:DUF4097 family beta strand repeat-containing protein n=1 Tax=Streptococcus caledonicus TaxID=2614158 RepID=A0ABW0UAW3_9STRE|nr:DUF4097 family beta strand repeat-containing protein [Streptococcus sp. S784/96/1]
MNTKSNTKWKYLLFFGLGSVVVGLSLLAFGAATGGIEGIKDNTKAIKEVKTFDKVKNLDINSFYNLTIKAGDVDNVTVTYYTHKKFRPKTLLNQSGDTLSVRQEIADSFVTGFMETGGYLLNERTGNQDYTETIITVPKNLVIENLNGQFNFHHSQLIDLKIKNINVHGMSYLENVTIDSGKISTYNSQIDNSHLSNVTFDTDINHLSFDNSTVENSTFDNFHASLSLENSHFKNVTFKATQIDDSEIEDQDEIETDYWYDQYDNPLYGHLSINSGTLENVTYTGAGELIGRNVNLIGKINLSGTFLSTDFKLTSEILKSTSLELFASHGTISIDNEISKNANAVTNTTDSSYQKKIDKAKADLIIKSKGGYISIR